MYIHEHALLHDSTCSCIYSCNVHEHFDVHVMYVFMDMYINRYVNIHVNMYVNMYIYIYMNITS
jgi:hypothetical protein